MNDAAVGFRVHSGWASLVAVTLEDGFPMVLLRSRPHLVKTFSFTFRQPYHAAQNASAREAPGIIARSRREARGLAFQAIRTVKENLQEQGYALTHSGLLLASGRPLPTLPQILKSHAMIHTADGELFREALLHGSKRCGLEAYAARERELLDMSSKALRMPPEAIMRRLTSLGAGLGPPWTTDEKLAALIAWLSLR